MKSLIIHGHFYQPPRENPWTGVVDPEPTASPFNDWNERVTAECYQPNASVEVVAEGFGKKLVNNYARISFDFGPTLLSWMEREAPETYSQILEADLTSVERNNGHGNAIAQAYSHAILPLCNQRDLVTQVAWGLADFSHRFKRKAESLWLPETACNDEVLGVLIDAGLRFVLLAPHQAARVHSFQEDAEWINVHAGSVDTSIPYRYFHRDGSRRSIDVFVYDQGLAGAIAFENALTSSNALLDRIEKSRHGARELVHVATDGESYGHHHKFGDLCLAYALEFDAPLRGWWVTNYGAYLDDHPPRWEIEINNGPLDEGTSWSCVHGVDRWNRNCGCSTGGEAHWNQEWRGPLRRALDFLCDAATVSFEATRGTLFTDPWTARNNSIQLWLNPEQPRQLFFSEHAPRLLTSDEQVRAFAFLEMQRNTILMYASCGWFFNDISGIEPVQILKYACCVIDLMDQLGLESPREQFLKILSEAKSNLPDEGSGADVFVRRVEPFRTEVNRVLVNG